MPTFPDHQPRHDGTRRLAPVPDQQVTLLAMVKRFADWTVENPHGEFWLATRKRGSEQRIIAANSVITLYGKLQRVEAEESQDGPDGTVYPDAAAAYLADLDRLGRIGTGK